MFGVNEYVYRSVQRGDDDAVVELPESLTLIDEQLQAILHLNRQVSDLFTQIMENKAKLQRLSQMRESEEKEVEEAELIEDRVISLLFELQNQIDMQSDRVESIREALPSLSWCVRNWSNASVVSKLETALTTLCPYLIEQSRKISHKVLGISWSKDWEVRFRDKKTIIERTVMLLHEQRDIFRKRIAASMHDSFDVLAQAVGDYIDMPVRRVSIDLVIKGIQQLIQRKEFNVLPLDMQQWARKILQEAKTKKVFVSVVSGVLNTPYKDLSSKILKQWHSNFVPHKSLPAGSCKQPCVAVSIQYKKNMVLLMPYDPGECEDLNVRKQALQASIKKVQWEAELLFSFQGKPGIPIIDEVIQGSTKIGGELITFPIIPMEHYVGDLDMFLERVESPEENHEKLLVQTPQLRAKLILSVIEAMRELHEKGMVHRDVKPANVLYNEKGTVLADWESVALLPEKGRELTDDQIISLETWFGSFGSMSPEYAKVVLDYKMQINGITDNNSQHLVAATTRANDLFGFGIICFGINGYQLGGQQFEEIPVGEFDKLFEKEPHKAVKLYYKFLDRWIKKIHDVEPSNEYEAVFKACLSMNPAERPSAAEIVDRYSRYIGNE